MLEASRPFQPALKGKVNLPLKERSIKGFTNMLKPPSTHAMNDPIEEERVVAKLVEVKRL